MVLPVLFASLGGAVVLGLTFGLDLLGLRLDFMGFSDDAAMARILREYQWDVIRGQAALLAVSLSFGAGFGALGGAVGAALRGALGRGKAFASGAAMAVVFHGLFFLRHMVKYPQLYSEAFYDRGGWRRTLQLFVTRHTSPALYVAAFVVIGIWLAIRLTPWLTPRASSVGLPIQARKRYAWAAVGALVFFSMIRWQAGHGAAARAARPNVLFIAVDSLRADRVFTPKVGRFPTLAALASKSARFRRAYVTVPRTFPSFVTLLTGRYPHHHGIRHMFPSAEEREHIGPSLPAAFRDAGWRTTVVSDYAGEIFARTPIGFQSIDVPRFDMHTIVALRGLQVHPSVLPYAAGLAERLFPFVRALPERADPALLTDRADSALRSLARSGQPFFATVFYSTPHFPYASPYPYYQRYVDPLYEGAFLYDKPPLATAPIGSADAQHIQALYDGAVAAVDDALATLLRVLDETGIADHTIVVLFADHGENLWEDPRTGMGHGDHLIGDRSDHVPLLIFDPRDRQGGRDIDAIVRDVDLAPTVAALCGLESAPPTDGVDLRPLLKGEQKDLGSAAFAETEYWFVPNGPGFADDERLPYPAVTGATDLAADGDVYMRPEFEPIIVAAKHRAIRLGDFRLRYQPTRRGVRFSLFDLREDPDERVDVSARHPERFVQLRDRLYEWMLADPGVVRRGDFVVPR